MKQKIDCNWHKCVDLDLPSGLLWATCNVGAKEPWESGLHLSWGNVDGHAKDSVCDFNYAAYQATPGASLVTNIPVDAGYDAARANLGGSWRMPTLTEFCELCDNCTRKWTTQNGVNGMLFISNINGKSVFFPAAGGCYGTGFNNEGACGNYWSSSHYSYTYYSYCLTFGSSYVFPMYYNSRFFGFTVRAVLGHPKDSLLIRTIKR